MFEWLFGGAFVAIHACTRYCTPYENRYSTTFFQFYFFLYVFYVASLILLYGLVGWILNSNPETLPEAFVYLGQLGVSLPEQLQTALSDGLTVPILLALLLTTLLPSIPKLKAFDSWLREHFWRLGNIPNEADQLASSMAFMPYVFPADTIAAVKAEADAQSIPHDRLTYDYRQDASYGWPFVTALYVILKSWKAEGRGKYGKFVRENAEQYMELERIYTQCSASARKYLSLPEPAAGDDRASAHGQELSVVHDQLFRASYDELVLKFIGLIARGILFAETTNKDRAKALAALGFANSGNARGMIAPGQYVTIFAIIIFGLVSIALGEALIQALLQGNADNARPPLTIGVLFFTALLTSAIFAAAILAVDVSKSLWRKQDAVLLRRQRPVRVAVTAGLTAVFFWLLVALWLRAVKYTVGGVENIHPRQLELCNLMEAPTQWLGLRMAWCDIQWSHPYLLQSAAVAVAIAFLAIRWPDRGMSDRGWREQLIDGLITAAVMALCSVVAYYWMEGIKIDGNSVFEGTRSGSRGGPVGLFVLKGALMAFVIGFLVPTWHRQANRSTALQRIRSILGDRISAKELADECDSIHNDSDLRRAFAAATALVVLAENRPNGKEMEVLNQFWQMFGRRRYARFHGVELRDDFQSYCRKLMLRLGQLKGSGCATPGANTSGSEGYALVLMQCLGSEIAHLDIVRGYDNITRILITLCVAIAEADSQVSAAELEVLDLILARLQLTREDAGIYAV